MQYTVENNQAKIIEVQSELTIAKCLNEGTVLQNFIIRNGKQDAIKLISEMILFQSQFFNLKQTFNQIQAVVCASDLVEKFPSESIEDFLMMFKLARQGQLCDKVWRLDSEVLFNWMANYLDFKYTELETQQKRKKSEQNNILSKTQLSPESQTQLDAFYKSFTERHKKKKYDPDSIPEFVDHHQDFISKLPLVVGKLSIDELKIEMKRALNNKLHDAYKIYEKELKKREYKLKNNQRPL